MGINWFFIRKYKMKITLITASEYPDLDGVACAIAYADFISQKDKSNKYFAKFGKGLQIEPKYIVEELGLKAEIIEEKESFDNFILVDASENRGLPSIVNPEKVLEIVDHRLFPEYKAFPNANFRVEPVGAATTQIAEYFYFNQEIELKPEIASLLQCAIYSNTINFQAESTTFRDERMRDWLETKVRPEQKDLPQRMFEYKTNYALENLEEALWLDSKEGNITPEIHMCTYQLEVTESQKFIERQTEIFELFKKIFPQHENQLLVVQDSGSKKTILLTDRAKVKEYLNRTNLNGKWISDTIFELNGILMRKGIIKALKEIK